MVLARGIAAGATLVALAAAGSALGGGTEPRTYLGEFERGGQVSFRLSANSNRVDEFLIEDITADCQGGTGKLDFEIYGHTPRLPNRTFEVRSEDLTGGKALIKGKFSRSYRRATGVVRVWGRFRFPAQGSTRCDSGKQAYVAR